MTEITQKPISLGAYASAAFSEIWTYFFFGGGPALLSIWGWRTGQQQPLWVFVSVAALGSSPAGFRIWKKERVERNERAAKLVKTKARLDELNHPRFVSEVEVAIEEDPQRPDWIKIYMNLVIRNQGAKSPDRPLAHRCPTAISDALS